MVFIYDRKTLEGNPHYSLEIEFEELTFHTSHSFDDAQSVYDVAKILTEKGLGVVIDRWVSYNGKNLPVDADMARADIPEDYTRRKNISLEELEIIIENGENIPSIRVPLTARDSGTR